MLGLVAACFGLYVASLFVALRAGEGRRLTWLIVAGAIGFRAILLLSQPIQEVDIYRYLWDGGVSAQGVSPFRFAPADVLAADQSQSLDTGGWSDDLLRLVQLRDESPGLADALRRVHYPELTTVYPPVSQSVFAVASVLTPSDAALSVRVTMMKGVLLIFDLATLALVLWLLRVSERHLGWGVAYGWCPLVIKEFANSGHLDAIAVCLTTASICCTARHYQVQREHSLRWAAASAVLLGLSVGAKLYAIVLLPLLALVTARRAGLRCGALFGMIGMIASVACLAPMLWLPPVDSLSITEDGGAPRLPNDANTTSATTALPSHLAETRSGLSAFLSRWEMNDFLFLIVVENLRPIKAGPDHPQPWFAVVPNGWRSRLASPLTSSLSIDHDRAAFLLARAVTASLFVVIVAALLGRVARDDHLPRFLEAVFLTLAWFWLLSPTQNPWYWTWALPLIPFARGRAWPAVSGLLFIYYLRFWLMYHWPEPGILGTWYDGRRFFDFGMTWVEFGPWLAWLTIAALVRRLRNSSNAAFEERLCGRLHREAGDLPLESRNHSEHVNEI